MYTEEVEMAGKATAGKAQKVAKVQAAIDAAYDLCDAGFLTGAQRDLVLNEIGVLRMLRDGIRDSGPQFVVETATCGRQRCWDPACEAARRGGGQR